MNDSNRDDKPVIPSILRVILARELPLEAETVRFLIVSIGDIFLTYYLLSGGGFTEANPIARFFIESWGPKGMVYFKFSMVSVVAVIAQIIARNRLETARRLLNFATVVVTIVLLYSLYLIIKHAPVVIP